MIAFRLLRRRGKTHDEIGLKMTSFNDQRLPVYEAFLNIEIAALPHMSAHLQVGFNNVFITSLLYLKPNAILRRVALIYDLLVTLHYCSESHHHLLNYARLNYV